MKDAGFILPRSIEHRFLICNYVVVVVEMLYYPLQLPLDPVMGGALMVRLKADFNTKTNKTGFLNVFKNTWHRRWYSQTGHFLNSWLYPEDQENEKVCILCWGCWWGLMIGDPGNNN